MQFFKTFYDLLLLRVKYIPEHPILAHPPLYAPFQYDRPNYSSVHINLHVLVANRRSKHSGQRIKRLPKFGLSL